MRLKTFLVLIVLASLSVSICSKTLINQDSPENTVIGFINALRSNDLETALSVTTNSFRAECGATLAEQVATIKKSSFQRQVQSLKSFKVHNVKLFDGNAWGIVQIDSGPGSTPMFNGAHSPGFYVERNNNVWEFGMAPSDQADERRKKEWGRFTEEAMFGV